MIAISVHIVSHTNMSENAELSETTSKTPKLYGRSSIAESLRISTSDGINNLWVARSGLTATFGRR